MSVREVESEARYIELENLIASTSPDDMDGVLEEMYRCWGDMTDEACDRAKTRASIKKNKTRITPPTV